MDFLNPYYLQIVVFALINVVNALSVFFAMSTGQISLGTAGFMAVGAYTSAILTMQYDIPMFVTVFKWTHCSTSCFLYRWLNKPFKRSVFNHCDDWF